MTRRQIVRSRLIVGAEWALWCSGLAVIATVVTLFREPAVTTGKPQSSFIPPIRTGVFAVNPEEAVDGALALLSRSQVVSDARVNQQNGATAFVPQVASPQHPPQTRPVLHGIVWIPTVGVLLEGAGLPDGGALLRVDTPRPDLKLVAVRGDSAFIRGRDSLWVLVLGSRNQ